MGEVLCRPIPLFKTCLKDGAINIHKWSMTCLDIHADAGI